MKKGFSLIELLAVIVILAIIALIATPIVLDIIDDTKESSLLRSAEFYLNAIEQSITQLNAENGGNFNPKSCEIEENGNIICDKNKDNVIELKLDGEKPDGGTITITNGKIDKVELYYKDKLITNKESEKLEYSPVIYKKVEDSNPGIICGEGVKEDLNQEICYIKSIEDLVELSALVNSGTTFENKKVELVYSLDFNSKRSYASKEVDEILITGEGFNPIGSSSLKLFKGTFEGNGNTIKGLYINRPETSNIGLFGYIDSATIQNLTLDNVIIIGYQYIGSLIGRCMNGTSITNININNINVLGDIIGGLGGYSSFSSILNVKGKNIKVSSVGGCGGLFSRTQESTISKFELDDVVIKSKNRNIGGLIGGNNLTNVSNGILSNIYIEGDGYTGGIIGANNSGNVKNIKMNGKVVSKGQYNGLAIGFNQGNVYNIVVEGNILGGIYTGGLIGRTSGTVDNKLNIYGVMLKGNVTGEAYSNRIVGRENNSSLNLLIFKDVLYNNKIIESDDSTSLNGKTLSNMGKVSQSEYEALGFEFESTDTNESYWYFNENDELYLMIK